MKNSSAKYFIFGIVCIVFGLTTDASNFIPAIYKYIMGVFFIGAAIYLKVKGPSKGE